MVGAVEAQKAEGVLHLHLFLFPQMAMQHLTLKEIAERFREHLLEPDAWKYYVESSLLLRCCIFSVFTVGILKRTATRKSRIL